MKGKVGYWAWPQRFYFTASGYPVVSVMTYRYKDQKEFWLGPVQEGFEDFHMSDNAGSTYIWVDKSAQRVEGEITNTGKIERRCF